MAEKKKGGGYMNELYHYGIPRRSGRYPWGSGDRPFQSEARIKGDYSLKRGVSKTAKTIASTVINRTLAMLVPGYSLLSAARATKAIKDSYFDKTDYVKRDGEYETISKLRKKTTNTTPAQDAKECNPRIGNQKGKINNCVFCSATYEMRRRGYDVQARRSGNGFQIDKVYNEWFKNPKIERPEITRNEKESRKKYMNRAYNDVCNRIEKYGDGARGTMVVVWDKSNQGHAFSWEVVNGQTTFYDGQSGKTNPQSDIFYLADPSKYAFVRLDNLEINPSITEAVVSKKGKGK